MTGIQITSANYTEAIDILKQRFAQKQVIVSAHMESLLNLQAVSRERDIKALRKLYDNIESNVRSLKTLGVNFEQYGTLLIPIIMSKLPEETRLVITKGIQGENWCLDVIMKILKIELEARETCGNLDVRSPGNSKLNQNFHTTSALLNNHERKNHLFVL